MDLSFPPRPRPRARAPLYPRAAAVGMVAVLASCQSFNPSEAPATPPAPASTAESTNISVIATDPPGAPLPTAEPPPAPPPVSPPVTAAFERIEDPDAQRVPAPCPGDCPNSFRVAGPEANLGWRSSGRPVLDARAVLTPIQKNVRACLMAWQPKRKTMQANILIRSTITTEGTLRGMNVEVTGEADGALTTCVANHIRDARFARRAEDTPIMIVAELARL